MSRLLVYLVTVIFCVTKTFAQSEPFYFIQLSDPQFGMLEKFLSRDKNHGKGCCCY